MDTKANRIPAADSGDFRRWPLPEISTGHIVPAASEAKRRPEPEAVRNSPTAAELEQIRREAYEDGRREGVERGYTDGHAQGHAEGYSQGQEQGRAAGAGDITAAVERLSRLYDQLLRPLDEQRVALQSGLTELALQLARMVIGRDPVTEPAQVAAAVEQALAALPAGAEGIEVFLHEADLELLEQSGRLRPEWRLTADAKLQPGDLRLQTRHSVVDFTRETRFQQLLAALLDDRPNVGNQEALNPDGGGEKSAGPAPAIIDKIPADTPVPTSTSTSLPTDSLTAAEHSQ